MKILECFNRSRTILWIYRSLILVSLVSVVAMEAIEWDKSSQIIASQEREKLLKEDFHSLLKGEWVYEFSDLLQRNILRNKDATKVFVLESTDSWFWVWNLDHPDLKIKISMEDSYKNPS